MNEEYSEKGLSVVCRVRPAVRDDELMKYSITPDGNGIVVDRKAKSAFSDNERLEFNFTKTMDQETTQEQAFSYFKTQYIKEFLRGKNVAIMAYGQTGAGKTHTVIGPMNWEVRGLVPRTIQYLFNAFKPMKIKPVMQVSFVEIYNEDVFDLLDPLNQERPFLEWPKMKISGDEIKGLSKMTPESKEDCLKLFMKGNEKRQTAATSMNMTSSRSHSIFCIYLFDPADPRRPPAKLYFVDLAGSERNARSKSVGKTFTEAKNINLSLLTLEKVVLSFERLSEGDKAHFPFRESNLTLLLKELFITDSILCIICNISPEKLDQDETLNTLKFCSRCKNLKIKLTHLPNQTVGTPHYSTKSAFAAISEPTVEKRIHDEEISKLAAERDFFKQATENLRAELEVTKTEVEVLRRRLKPESEKELTPEEVLLYKQKADKFMDGQIEELELNSIAEAHIYLEFVRQMKDQNTRKFLKQTKEISDKLENYTVIHEQFYKDSARPTPSKQTQEDSVITQHVNSPKTRGFTLKGKQIATSDRTLTKNIESGSSSPTVKRTTPTHPRINIATQGSDTIQEEAEPMVSPKEKEIRESKTNKTEPKVRVEDRTSEIREPQPRDSQHLAQGVTLPMMNIQPVIPGGHGFYPFYVAPMMMNYIQATAPPTFISPPGMVLSQTMPPLTSPVLASPGPTYLPANYQQIYGQQASQYQYQPILQQSTQFSQPYPPQYQPQVQPIYQQPMQASDNRYQDTNRHSLAQNTQTSGVLSPSHRQQLVAGGQGQPSEAPRQETQPASLQNYNQHYFQHPMVEERPALNVQQQSSHTLSYTNSQPTPSFGHFGGAGGSQQSGHLPSQRGDLDKPQYKEMNIFKQESFHNTQPEQQHGHGSHNHQYKSFREVFTDSTTAAYGNPGQTVQEYPYGQASPLFRGANGGSGFQHSGIADRFSYPMGEMTKENTVKELLNTPSRSYMDNSRLSARAGQSASLNRSSVAYDSLLSRRKQALNTSSQSVTTSGRFPRMKSKKYVYFDLDEATFDKDKSGDNIHIE